MPQDHYDVLEVPRDASRDEIRKAYRRIAARLHPDRNPGDKEAERKFKEISAAYDVLVDTDKRRVYDQGGVAAAAPQPFRPGPVWVRGSAKKTGPVRVDPFKAAMKPGTVYSVRKPVQLGPVPVTMPAAEEMPEVPLFTRGRKGR